MNNWPCPSLDAAVWKTAPISTALGRVGLKPCPGSTVELSLVAAVWVNWPEDGECERPSHSSAVERHGHRDDAPHNTPTLLSRAVKKAAHRVMSTKKLFLSISSYSSWRAGPAPYLDRKAELTLVARTRVQES